MQQPEKSAWMKVGLIVNWLLVPFFIYEINKSRRDKSKLVSVRVISIDNFLCGYSCADIESILWSYGIPTHFIDLDVEKDLVSDTFLVPSTQHFFADVVLRQNEEKYGYVVTSSPVYQGQTPSTAYRYKTWQRWGVMVKQKSWVNRIALFFFGDMLSMKFPAKKPKSKRKNN